jgi:hypothetical protein
VGAEASKSFKSQVAVHGLRGDEAGVKMGQMAAVPIIGMCCRFVQKYC